VQAYAEVASRSRIYDSVRTKKSSIAKIGRMKRKCLRIRPRKCPFEPGVTALPTGTDRPKASPARIQRF
jgi:hypothetical protein